ncbi:hypothetical protein KBI23_06595 [bacterium]|nr:hypothetical protein [bacterium]MBP9807128.1 hypothetical protein [bacterium]
MIGFYHRCPANSALVVSSSSQLNNKSIKRITKQSTWINPFKDKVFVIDLSAITIPFTLHLPTATKTTAAPSGELLLHCHVTTQIDSMDENIKLAATKGYADKKSNAAQLSAIIKRIKVTPERLPASLESFCTSTREREESKISQAINEALQQEGFFLYSFEPTAVSISGSGSGSGSDLSYCSQMLRELKFEPYISEVKITLPAREPYWGEQTLTWQTTIRPPSSIDQYAVACKNFLNTSSSKADEICYETVSKALSQAVQITGADRLLERALKPLANLPLNTCSCGREATVMLLNALSDSLSTWRGKLAVSRLALDTISTLTRLDKEIDLQTAESFAALGLVLEKISLIAVDSKNKPEPWQEPSADETIIRLELPLPVKLEEDNKEVTLVLKCMVCIERNGQEAIQPETQTELSKLFTDNLLTALSSTKVPRAVAVVKKLVENIHSKLGEEQEKEPGSKWETRIEDVLKEIGPTGIVFNSVRIIFAALDAYNDVRKKFLASSGSVLHSHKLTIKYCSLADLDLLDQEGKSFFADSK